MKYIMWKEEYNIGVEEIDKQHLEWCNMINKMYESRSAAYLHDKIQTQVAEFVELLKEHFKDEETFLNSQGCEDVKTMVGAHMKLIAMASQWESEFHKHGNEGDFAEFLKFQRDYFVSHTQTMDRKFFLSLKKA